MNLSTINLSCNEFIDDEFAAANLPGIIFDLTIVILIRIIWISFVLEKFSTLN